MNPMEGRKRVVIESVKPQVDCGRYAVRRFLGDRVTVSVAMFGDGHDHVAGRLLFRPEREQSWRSVPLVSEGNDIWSASFVVDALGVWLYAVEGWIDHLGTWCADFAKRLEAQPERKDDAIAEGDSFGADPEIPAARPQTFRSRCEPARRCCVPLRNEPRVRTRSRITDVARLLERLVEQKATDDDTAIHSLISPEICDLANRYPDLTLASRTEDFPLRVDRERARFSTWYELFPRSAAAEPGRHGTFADVEGKLPTIAAMGFDVLYLPPISPIGEAFRKGPNNTVVAQPGRCGQPVGGGFARRRAHEHSSCAGNAG